MPKPNTFIVGAPKCGTTAICDYLDRHPQVFVCKPKEPHFFVRQEMPDQARASRHTLESYEALFGDSPAECEVRVEGSVWYLFSQTALANIREYDPSAKIVVMLRRPDEMIYSMHNQARLRFEEDVIDFNEAWEISMKGNNREKLPELCTYPAKLHYDKIARYSEQLERVYTNFSHEQVHVIFYDDFKQDAKSCYLSLLSFLGLEPFDIDFNRVNANKVNKNEVVGRLLRKPPRFILEITKVIRSVTGVKNLGWRDKLDTLNRKTEKRSPLDSKVRGQILDAYESDIKKLEILCDRDLSDWRV